MQLWLSRALWYIPDSLGWIWNGSSHRDRWPPWKDPGSLWHVRWGSNQWLHHWYRQCSIRASKLCHHVETLLCWRCVTMLFDDDKNFRLKVFNSLSRTFLSNTQLFVFKSIFSFTNSRQRIENKVYECIAHLSLHNTPLQLFSPSLCKTLLSLQYRNALAKECFFHWPTLSSSTSNKQRFLCPHACLGHTMNYNTVCLPVSPLNLFPHSYNERI